MYVTVVYVKVIEGKEKDFLQACQKNHEAAIQETGNCRFDVLQQQENSSNFILYEAYDSKDAAAAHKETAHYAIWRDSVADWMAEPRQGVVYQGHYPE